MKRFADQREVADEEQRARAHQLQPHALHAHQRHVRDDQRREDRTTVMLAASEALRRGSSTIR